VDHKNTSATTAPHAPRIVDLRAALELKAEGWAAADLHVHTLHSYDVMPTWHVHPLVLYRKARRMGMTFVALTDHDTMDAYDEIGWTREGLVPAVEVKILDPRNVGHTVHINVYTLSRAQFREIRKISQTADDVEKLTSYLKAERLPYTFNHPFWHEPGETPHIGAVFDIAELFPVLEYNMGRISRINQQALRLARAKGKGLVAATDSHIGDIGRAFSLAPGATFGEFFERISAGRAAIFPADLTLPRLKEETAIRIRRLVDKSGWLHPKDSLELETGHAILDRIVARLARAAGGRPRLSDRALAKVLGAVSSSGIPGSLYVRYQQNLADEIGRFLESAEAGA
jgi:predicted metal-dependent phosphoesterase TrpH